MKIRYVFYFTKINDMNAILDVIIFTKCMNLSMRPEFEARADAVPLKTEWLPKSQLQAVVRRP
jgi:hypothetical protein